MSGIPLAEQQLTSTGIPIVIHKCLQFIESIGLDIEGLYRISGIKVKIRRLILAFNQGERGEGPRGGRGPKEPYLFGRYLLAMMWSLL